MQGIKNLRKMEKQRIPREILDLIDFFDAYEGNPYQRSAISQLYSNLIEKCPELLEEKAEWVETWKWGGKKKIRN